MIKKTLPYVLVIFVLLFIFSLDRVQNKAIDKAKVDDISSSKLLQPKIKIDGKDVLFKSGDFAWVKQGTGHVIDEDEPPLLFHDLLPISVKPLSTMKISFPVGTKIDNIEVYQSLGGLEKGNLSFNPVSENSYTFNNVAGLNTVIIQAFSNGQEYHFTFPMIIEEVISYQSELAEEIGFLSILELYKPGDQQENWALQQINNNYVHKAHSIKVETVEEAQQLFPDLTIETLPYYAIFNHETLLYHANNHDDFFTLLKVAVP